MAEPDQPDTESAGARRSRPIAVWIFAGAAVVLAILYGIMSTGGKKQTVSAACAPAEAVASRLAPLATGELAALAINKKPKSAVEIAFDGPDGKKLSLKDFRGKTVLLNLWATWCVPCRAEMPDLDRLEGALGSDTFEVVAVNIDTARLERRKPFLKSVGVTKLKFYADPKAESFQTLKQAGKVIGLPTTLLIGPKGCELGRMAGPAKWDSDQAKKLIQAATKP